MFKFLKEVILDGTTKQPSSKRWVLVVTTIFLCVGYFISMVGVFFGSPFSDTVILGLAGILATLAGGSYGYTKAVELKSRSKEDKNE